MSRTCLTKRAILLLLFVGMILITSGVARTASGITHSLISVRINGIDAVESPHPLVQARLRSELVIDVAWQMYYNPGGEQGSVQFFLFNNVSSIQNSTVFTDIGPRIDRSWNATLVPQEWTMNGRREYGKIVILFTMFDGFTFMTDFHEFAILVLPEELDCAFSSLSLENDSYGRMNRVNASFAISSIQDPSYIYSGLGFTCEILDSARSIIGTRDFFVNDEGFLPVIIEKTFLIYLENNSFKLRNHDSDCLEPVTIERNLGELIHRTDLGLYFLGMTEIEPPGNTSLPLTFESRISSNGTNVSMSSLYFTWQLENGSWGSIDNGSIVAMARTNFTIVINAEFVKDLENLAITIWFEGNFMLRSNFSEYWLADNFHRDAMAVTFTNYASLRSSGTGSFRFQLENQSSLEPVIGHRIDIEVSCTGNSILLFKTSRLSDEHGCTDLAMTREMLDRLDILRVLVRSIADSKLKEATLNLNLCELFPRVQPVAIVRNDTSMLSLEIGTTNTIAFEVTINGSDGTVRHGTMISISLVDASNRVLENVSVPVDENGLIEFILPVDRLQAKQRLTIIMVMNATLQYRPLMFTTRIFISTVTDPAAILANAAITACTSISLVGASLITLLLVSKRFKKSNLTKKDFTVSVNKTVR